MSSTPRGYPALVYAGSAVLAAGGVLHLVLGFPWLIGQLAGADPGFGSGMKAVWIASGLDDLFLSGIAVTQAKAPAPSRIILILVAMAALASSLAILWFVRMVIHPAVLILSPAGILLLAAAACHAGGSTIRPVAGRA